MSASSSDPVVASLADAVLRRSDLDLLRGPHWLNDRVISFYFEYLHHHKFDASTKICFVSPEVSQFLKLVSPSEIPVFLAPLALEDKEVILLAVNNASDPDAPGGSHWSLLIFSRQAREFFHLDSSPGDMNDLDARLLSKKLFDFLSTLETTNNKFPFKYSEVPVIRQTNGYDCGIHLLSHAEHATRHYLVYGNADGLEPLVNSAVKSKRAEVLQIALGFGDNKANGDASGGGR